MSDQDRRSPAAEITLQIDRFNRAWQGDEPPNIATVLSQQPVSADPRELHELLCELVLIDLEHRWRRTNAEAEQSTLSIRRGLTVNDGFPACPRLEDYVARFAQLGSLAELPAELIAEEYRVRTRWGDRPAHQHYAKRFIGINVVTLLCEVDAELEAEKTKGPLRSDATVHLSAAPPLESDATKLPRQFGDYELLEEIARGGMGVVYRARQVSLNRIVALKMILSGQLAGAEEVKRFRREAEAAAALDHPHIVPVHEVGEHDGQQFFSMGFVAGESLADRLAAGPLPPAEAADLTVTISAAISYAHSQGVIHRDLKPANVLLDQNGEPRITDFGLAKSLTGDDELTATGQILGTPSYMPPEQAAGRTDQITEQADVYALGAILYALLSGRPPFQANNPFDTMRQVREKEPVSPRQLNPAIDRDLDTICLKCLDKDRQRRYPSAKELADELRRFQRGEPIEARPASAIYRLRKAALRNKGLFVAGGLVVIAVVAGLISTALGLLQARRQAGIARANLETAEENYALARDAVDRYFTTVSENRLLNEPYMDGLRRELLTSAREFYLTFIQRRQGDSAAVADLANAHLKLGRISYNIGDADTALAEFKAARSVLAAAGGVSDSRIDELRIMCGTDLAMFWLDYGEYDRSMSLLDEVAAQAEALMSQPSLPSFNFQTLMARVLSVRGDVFYHQNQLEAAERDFARGIEILEQLVAEYPDFPIYARDLGDAYDSLGTLMYGSQRNDLAEDWFGKALVVRREYVVADNGSAASRSGLARTLVQAAMTSRRKKQLDEALALAEEAVELGRALVSEHPELAIYRHHLVSFLGNLSVIHKDAGDQPQANRLNAEAMQVLADMVDQHPDDADLAIRLGALEGNEGNSRLSARKWSEAVEWYDRSIATLQSPLAKSPHDPHVRNILRNNYWGRADALVALNRFDDAITAMDKTIELAAESARSEICVARAMVFVHSGNHQAAASAVASEVARLEGLGRSMSARNWFGAAEMLTAAAAVARSDADLEGQQQVSSELEGRAVVALRRAFDLGHFGDSTSESRLLSERFRSLRSHPEFQRLLEDAEVESNEADSNE